METLSFSRAAGLFSLALFHGAVAAAASPVSEQLEHPQHANVTITGHVLEPQRLEPTAERVDGLKLPSGFAIDVFAENLTDPRMLAVADDGTVYVTRRSVGDVLMLKDDDGDGRADRQQPVASRPQMHGIAIDGDTLYLITVSDVYRATRNADGTLGELERIIDDLPEGGQHPNRTLAVGPDGKLYISVGSTCNACGETSPENATLLRAETDGSYRSIHASGLRNTIGFAFVPGSGELYGMDHGIDWLGDNQQHEELNHLVKGHTYGWPYVYADGRINPQDEPPDGISPQAWARQSTPPVGLYVPHAAPMQMAFYTAEAFPDEYRGDAFVAMHGSWNRQPPSGYEVARVRFENGEPVAFEPFLTGFLTRAGENGWGYFGRPVGIAQAADGSLLLADDGNGRIYRISHSGGSDGPARGRESAEGPAFTNTAGAEPKMLGGSVAKRTGTSKEKRRALEVLAPPERLDVSSPAFADGSTIPEAYAAEQENISPPLTWQQPPEGTRSIAVVVEDPDAPGPQPYVHWLAYNLPPETTRLREGVPGSPRVPVPDGMTQGANDSGSTGWTGMKPPVGDQPHDYHFQVFALDRPLEVPHGADREALLTAMRGHVLAAGEVVGTYQRAGP